MGFGAWSDDPRQQMVASPPDAERKLGVIRRDSGRCQQRCQGMRRSSTTNLSRCVKRCTAIILGLGCATLLLANAPWIVALGYFGHQSSPGQGVPVPRATPEHHFDLNNEVGVVLLGLGPFARQLKCESAIESLRVNAGWMGPVYLVTDAPQCFHHSRWGGCGLNATIIEVSQDLSSGWTMPSLSATKGNRLLSKSYKMQIFDLIPDPSVKILMYMDCDILLGQAPCFQQFLQRHALRGWGEQDRIKFFVEYPAGMGGANSTVAPEALHSLTHREEGSEPEKELEEGGEQQQRPAVGIHGGMFIAHRDWSQPVLDRWRAQLMTQEDASDQMAFRKAGITEYTLMEPSDTLYRPKCSRDDCQTVDVLCFNHVHNARCVAYGSSSIQGFVDRWGLCTLQDIQYCTPLYMTPFSYTWLPYSSCHKMELGLLGSFPTSHRDARRPESYSRAMLGMQRQRNA